MSAEPTPQPDLDRVNTKSSDVQQTLLELSSLVGRKWQLLILYHLLTAGGHGFKQLKTSIEGISGKVLSSNLEDLEDKGLVNRSIEDTKPVRVEYSLTERGRRLAPLLDTIQTEYVASGFSLDS